MRDIWCDITGLRDDDILKTLVTVDYSELSGQYSLNLVHPQHRAVLRLLLQQADEGFREGKVEGSGPEAAFRAKVFQVDRGDRKAAGPPWYRSELARGGWGVAEKGQVSFNYKVAAMAKEEGEKVNVMSTNMSVRWKSPEEQMKNWLRQVRISITMGRFVTLYCMFACLDNAKQRQLLVAAVSEQLLLKQCHLKALMAKCPDIMEFVARKLVSTVLDMDRSAIFDLLKNKDAARRLRGQAKNQFFFNGENPTDHYELDLANPSDRGIAEKLFVTNLFERLTQIEIDAPDVSQWGNQEGCRNVSHRFFPYTIKSFVGFSLPFDELLKMDYSSPARPSLNARTLPDSCVEEMVKAIEESESSWEDRVRALRLFSHRMVLSPQQVRAFLDSFPNVNVPKPAPKAKAEAGRPSLSQRLSNAKRKLSLMSKLGLLKQVKSAFGLIIENYRMEAFICLWPRCPNQPGLCNLGGIYNEKVFSHRCCKEFRTRLGRARTFDAIDCCNPKANPPSGNRHEMILTVHEDWLIARFLVILAAKEDGENMLKSYWSERGFLAAQGMDFIVPEYWLRELPREGTFACTYVSELPEYKLPDARRRLAERFFGWPTNEVLFPSQESLV